MKQNEIEEIEGEIWTTARFIFKNGCSVVFENYKVSNMGRVKSLNYKNTGNEKVLNQYAIDTDGAILYKLCLYNNNKAYHLQTHRLVLCSFRPEDWFPGAVVDHIDRRTESVCNNNLSNLRFVTPSTNRDTKYCNEAIRKALTNRSDLSKRVCVKDLSTGETTDFPSISAAGRALELKPCIITICINRRRGVLKRLNLHFSYIE